MTRALIEMVMEETGKAKSLVVSELEKHAGTHMTGEELIARLKAGNHG
jgi:hypothetical protein